VASAQQKGDTFSRSQDHWGKNFNREMTLVSNYQRMMDYRLSKPKSINTVSKTNGRTDKVFKNSSFLDQMEHQSAFKRGNSI
jgi:hypothetical protein